MTQKQSTTYSQVWGKETQFFFALTPDKILDAVEAAGIRCSGRVLPLNSLENRVYEVEIEVDDPSMLQTPSERFRIAKFYRPGRWTPEQILEEHQFLADLVEDEIPAVAPIPFPDGSTLRQSVETGIWFCLFPKIGGRAIHELDHAQLAQIGRLLARLHNVGAVRQVQHRTRLTPSSYGLNNLQVCLAEEIIPSHLARPYEELVRRIVDIISPWFEKAPYQRIHGDCHNGNLLWGSSGPFLVDFDDMVIGPPVQDIWLLLPGRDDDTLRQRRVLLEGYEQMGSFDHSTIRLIEPLRTLRMIHFATWIGKRLRDPAFPHAFPDYGTDRYWQELIQDLHEQLELITTADTELY
ncbi:MAG: serine/threonine protein kinase [bacterium]|nr:serine/threonine protein kinase [bacterium]